MSLRSKRFIPLEDIPEIPANTFARTPRRLYKLRLRVDILNLLNNDKTTQEAYGVHAFGIINTMWYDPNAKVVHYSGGNQSKYATTAIMGTSRLGRAIFLEPLARHRWKKAGYELPSLSVCRFMQNMWERGALVGCVYSIEDALDVLHELADGHKRRYPRTYSWQKKLKLPRGLYEPKEKTDPIYYSGKTVPDNDSKESRAAQSLLGKKDL